MNIKFAKISKCHFRMFKGKNILTKGIVAKLCGTEELKKKSGETYGKFTFIQGKSRINVLAYGYTYQVVKNVLKTDKVTKFPAETFTCKPRDKKYNSNSTCKYELTFRPWSRFITGVKSTSGSANAQNVEGDFCNLKKVYQLLRTSKPITRKLKSIKFHGGEVYRYLGCKTCNSSIPRKHTDGKYYCKGSCINKLPHKKKIGVACERKICLIIYNIELSDETSDTIDSVVIFNSVCELLLKKSGFDFNTDNEAVTAWKELIADGCFNITLKRNTKKKGSSSYPPALFVHTIDDVKTEVLTLAASTSTGQETELPSEYSYDAKPDENIIYIKQKNDPVPDFPLIDMKLQYTSQRYEEWRPKYQINSKTPGLVLLINNFNFPSRKEKQRVGSEIDINLLQRGFIEMGYAIFGNKCHLDIKTKVEFARIIRDFKDELIETNYDSLFVVISSHGVNNAVILPGEPEVSISVVTDIMALFSDDNFPAYQGKPKVFMPITCQNLGNSALGNGIKCSDFQLFDMLICCPSFPGYVQRRFHQFGSLFVHCLVDNLMKYATSWDLVEILNKVQDDFKEQIRKKSLQIAVPYFIGSAFGKFVLVPSTKLNDDNPSMRMEMD